MTTRIRNRLGLGIVCALAAMSYAPGAQAAGLTWSGASNVDHGGSLNAVDCPSSSFCIAVDNKGNILTSSDPFSADPAWAVTYTFALPPANPPSGGDMTGLSCVGTTNPACAATDQEGDVFTSNDPDAAHPTWNVDSTITNGGPEVSGISCFSESLCAAITYTANNSTILASIDAFTGSPTWSSSEIFTVSDGDTGVSCPATNLCVVVEGGAVIVSTQPGVPSPTWTPYTTPDSDGPVNQVPNAAMMGLSCPSTSLCVADDSAGGVLTSTDPGQPNPTYVRQPVDGTTKMAGLSCYSTSLCLAADSAGNVIESTDPGAATPTWTSTKVDSGALNSVACASATQCVAVDGTGNLFVGQAGSSTSSPPPAPTVTGPVNGRTYTATTLPHLSYSCTPATGQTLAACSATLNGTTALASGSSLPSTAGSYTLVVKATDTDGLSSSTTVHYTVSKPSTKVKVGKAKAKGSGVSVSVTCASKCSVKVTLLTTAKKHPKTLGSATASLKAGKARTITIKLNKLGRTDLKHHHRLSVVLQTTIRINGKTTKHDQKLTLK